MVEEQKVRANEEIMDEDISQETPEKNEDSVQDSIESKPAESQSEQASGNLDELKKNLEHTPPSEEKLGKAIELMELSLAQSGNPHFRIFWESRKIALDLFKESLQPTVKSLHWTRYRELTKEAKRLKELFEEKTAFAVEQLEFAIEAIEKDIREFDLQVEKSPYPDFPGGLEVLAEHHLVYREGQRSLTVLNAYAARINGLRRELIKTEMRIRQKNQFFQRLSKAGDDVFPRRKELIKEISTRFSADIVFYVNKVFPERQKKEKSLHVIRQEIKSLQAMAKILTLNTQAFTQTRLKLSECWDQIKVLEKEKRKEHANQKQVYKEHADAVRVKIEEFSALVEQTKPSLNDAKTEQGKILDFMRKQQLGKEDVKALRDALNNVLKPLREKQKEEEKRRQEIELKKEQERQKHIDTLREVAEGLHKRSEKGDSSDFESELQALEQQIESLQLVEKENESFERLLIPIKDALAEHADREILDLLDSDPEKITKMKDALTNLFDRRAEIKERLEKFRKTCGGSGLDFEQSLFFNEQLTNEKARFDKVNERIELFESKVRDLKR